MEVEVWLFTKFLIWEFCDSQCKPIMSTLLQLQPWIGVFVLEIILRTISTSNTAPQSLPNCLIRLRTFKLDLKRGAFCSLSLWKNFHKSHLMLTDLPMIKFTTNHDKVFKNTTALLITKLGPSFLIITNTLYVVRGITNYRKNYNSYYKLRQILTQNKCLHLYLIIRGNTTLAQLKPNLYSIYWLLLSYKITSLRDTHPTFKFFVCAEGLIPCYLSSLTVCASLHFLPCEKTLNIISFKCRDFV